MNSNQILQLLLVYVVFINYASGQTCNLFIDEKNGDDRNTCATKQAACLTLSKALACTAGSCSLTCDIILSVAPGVYSGALNTGLTIVGNTRSFTLLAEELGTVTFDAGSQSRVFVFQNYNLLTISGVNFTRGSSGVASGGCLYFDSGTQTYIENSSFTKCVSGSDGGAIASQTLNTVVLNKVMVSQSQATTNGGALSLNNVEITFSSFLLNFASQGGAIYSQYVQISNSTFVGNEANSSGGALYITNGQASLRSNLIIENSALDNNGGGLYLSGNGVFEISDCTIDNNFANRTGGGIYYSTTSGTISISRTLIEHNSAYDTAGGAYLSGSASSSLSVTGSTINDNVANLNGGGLFFDGFARANLDSTTFLENSGWHGGALFCGTGVQLKALSVKFFKNFGITCYYELTAGCAGFLSDCVVAEQSSCNQCPGKICYSNTATGPEYCFNNASNPHSCLCSEHPNPPPAPPKSEPGLYIGITIGVLAVVVAAVVLYRYLRRPQAYTAVM